MGVMTKTLEKVKILHCWGDLDVLSQIDEKEDDIWLLVTFQDHGDEFVVIGTKDDHTYLYGFFEIRSDWMKYLGKNVREYTLYKKLDDRAKAANSIYFKYRDCFVKKGGFMESDKPKIYSSNHYAQMMFDKFLEYMNKKIQEELRISNTYDYKNKIKNWLNLNEIDTEENLKKLEETKFDTKINGVDGIAEKREIDSHSFLGADHFDKIFINGKNMDRRKVSKYCGLDEWGVARYSMNLGIFSKG